MMYFAHAIFYKKKDNKDGNIMVCEKVFSIKGDDDDKFDKLNFLAEEVVKDFLTKQGVDSDWIFAGVRKIIEISIPWINLPIELTGIQMTESIFEVSSMKDVKNLVKGKMVELTYTK